MEPGWRERERESKHGNSDGEDNDERDSLKVREKNKSLELLNHCNMFIFVNRVIFQPSLQSSVVATKAPPRPNADPDEDEGSKKRLVKYQVLSILTLLS